MTPMKYVKRGWPDWEISIKTHVSGIMWSRTELFRPKTPQNLCQPAQTTFNRKLPTSNINKRRKNWPTDSRDGHRCVSKLFQIHVDTTLFIIYNLQHDYNLFVIHHSTFFSSTNFVLISLLIYRKESGNNRLQFFKRRHFITTELLCKCTPPITSALIALHWLGISTKKKTSTLPVPQTFISNCHENMQISCRNVLLLFATNKSVTSVQTKKIAIAAIYNFSQG